MDLKALKRQWHAWGTKDPLWAAVTTAGKEDRRWDVGEFMRSGEEEIDFVLAHLSELGVALRLERALDFGCAVGRHTQALARRFAQADGVDIAPSMVEQARRFNPLPNCRFHLNERQDLALFPDASFSFVWSILVLQHMRPDYAAGYVKELLRVLAPGGALVFQLPQTVVPTAEPPAGPDGLRRTIGARPLLPSGFRAGLTLAPTEPTFVAGAAASIEVHVENLSTEVWPALGDGSGRYRVQLTHRWVQPNGAIVVGNEARAALPCDLPPGEGLDLVLWFTVPAEGGRYVLELDMVQEGVAWFHEKGSAPARVSCRVEGGARMATDLGPGPAREPAFAGFRQRHPVAHRALAALGIVPAYRSFARLTTRFRVWRQRARRPVMEMYGLPIDEVSGLVAEGSGRLLETETQPWPHGIVSCRYWVVKD